jgi:hypothetical protein
VLDLLETDASLQRNAEARKKQITTKALLLRGSRCLPLAEKIAPVDYFFTAFLSYFVRALDGC